MSDSDLEMFNLVRGIPNATECHTVQQLRQAATQCVRRLRSAAVFLTEVEKAIALLQQLGDGWIRLFVGYEMVGRRVTNPEVRILWIVKNQGTICIRAHTGSVLAQMPALVISLHLLAVEQLAEATFKAQTHSVLLPALRNNMGATTARSRVAENELLGQHFPDCQLPEKVEDMQFAESDMLTPEGVTAAFARILKDWNLDEL